MPEPSASTITWKATISLRAAASRTVRPSQAALPFASGLRAASRATLSPSPTAQIEATPAAAGAAARRSASAPERDRLSHRGVLPARAVFPLTNESASGQGQRHGDVPDDGRALAGRGGERERHAEEPDEPGRPAQEAEDLRGRVVAARELDRHVHRRVEAPEEIVVPGGVGRVRLREEPAQEEDGHRGGNHDQHVRDEAPPEGEAPDGAHGEPDHEGGEAGPARRPPHHEAEERGRAVGERHHRVEGHHRPEDAVAPSGHGEGDADDHDARPRRWRSRPR